MSFEKPFGAMEPWLLEMTILSNRHARSAGQENPENYIIFGDSRVPLALIGHAQAEAAGDAYEAYFAANPPQGKVALLSSGHVRAVQTKTIYLPRIKSAVISHMAIKTYLGEHRYGAVNGVGVEGVAAQFPDFPQLRREAIAKGECHMLPYPGFDADGVLGESQFEVHGRTAAIRRDLRALYDHGFWVVIINSHGTSGRGAQMNILGVPSTDENWKGWPAPNNCQIDLIHQGVRRCLHIGAANPDEPCASKAIAQAHPLIQAGIGTP